ncbi:Calmodulin-like protein 6 [Camelus dromedarius]|uniref:Calmodulin-like protein 6 n=1 Tax=Camelus dromedarius TaxID=9838 RepID=A0A5N4DCS8_CAMDR|nr:Calmodulin-like protein 6 [Camelus dromedarius]
MTEHLMAEQVREYKRVFEMFDEEGNGAVRMDQLERLMSLLDINPTKSELASIAKDVDRDRSCTYVLMNTGETNEVEADKDGDGTIDYEEFVAMTTGESFKPVQ